MDWKSHILVGILFAIIFGISEWIRIIVFVLGSVLPDLSVILFYLYFNFDKKKMFGAFTNDKENPRNLFVIYNSLHSFLLIFLIFVLGYFFDPFYYLAAGMILHVLVDILLHKDHAIRIFYPFTWKFRKGINWWDYYGKTLKSRIIIWIILILLIILASVIRYSNLF